LPCCWLHYAGRVNSSVRLQTEAVVNWGKITSYALLLFLAGVAIGFIAASFPPSATVLSSRLAAAFVVYTAVYAHLAMRQPARPYLHAWAVFALESLLGVLGLVALTGVVSSATAPLALVGLLVHIGALAVGTAVGSSLRRHAGQRADA
jgi:hypothetical protein